MNQNSPPPPQVSVAAIRGAVLHFLDHPAAASPPQTAWQYWEDGLIVVQGGKVTAVGDSRDLSPEVPREAIWHDWRGKLIMPGFVDTHIHYPQVDVIASPGKQLLHWLNDYTFPAEAKFADHAHASKIADFFLDQLLAHGTTTAHVFCTVHETSTEAFFEAAQRRGLRMVAGKVLMDRHAPDYLLEPAQAGYDRSRALIQRWHGKGRLSYALTPRFAPTSTDAQLALTGALAREFPDVTVHTHLAENRDEIAWVAQLFPKARDYLDVYARHGLVRRGSVFAHGVWLEEAQCRQLAEAGAWVAHSPTSNLFLGSGLYNLPQAEQAGMGTCMATDVGGGFGYSMLQVLAHAYQIQQLRGHTLDVWRAFYMATLGGARALMQDQHIGNFTHGHEFDAVVLDWAATPVLARRAQVARSLEEKLFALMLLGDDRAVAATYSGGQRVWLRS